MSELKVEDLQKLSAKKLEAYIANLEGEDKVLAEKVLASKKSGKLAEAEAEEVTNDAKKAEREAEREKLRKEKEEAAAKLAEEKAAKEAERKAKRIAAIEERDRKKQERAQAFAARKEEILARKKEREAIRLKKEEEQKALKAKKEEEKAEKEAARKKRAEEIAARLRELDKNPDRPLTKTDRVRELVMEGLTNSEIAKVTNYGIKFVCDTVWRLERQAEAFEAKQAADQALADKVIAEREAAKNETKEATEE